MRSVLIRTTQLDYSSCHPTPISRLKVNLDLNVFNEKTVAAIKMINKQETAEIVEVVLRMWKLTNIKNLYLHIRLADDDRRPFQLQTIRDRPFFNRWRIQYFEFQGEFGGLPTVIRGRVFCWSGTDLEQCYPANATISA